MIYRWTDYFWLWILVCAAWLSIFVVIKFVSAAIKSIKQKKEGEDEGTSC